MANKITNTQHYQAIADAIRAKNGETTTYTPSQMAQAIEDLPSKNASLEALLSGKASGNVTVSGVENLGFTKIALNGYNNTNPVTALHMPDLTSWHYSADSGGLVDAGNSILQTLDLPLCTKLYTGHATGSETTNIFTSLTTLIAPELKSFYGILRGSAVTSLNLPKMTVSGKANAFYGCTRLTSVNMPVLATCRASMFQGCSALTQIILPRMVIGYSYVFADCTSLDLVDLGGKGGTIGTGTFRNCPLTALVLRSSTVPTLSNTNAFQGSNIEAGTGYIYVPRDLISSYESASNWSTFAGQFRALEDYTDDGTTTGEFIMPT